MKIIVTYRRTSRMSMRISQSGDIRISAPYGTDQSVINDFVDKNRDWISAGLKKMEKARLHKCAFFSQLPLSTPQQCADATRRLNEIIRPLVERYSEQMGVSPACIRYQAMVSRWGVCNIKTRKITFSAYLLLLPDVCIEHTVVHELAHLLVPNHSDKFYAIMDRHFPRWKEARKLTRQIYNMDDGE